MLTGDRQRESLAAYLCGLSQPAELLEQLTTSLLTATPGEREYPSSENLFGKIFSSLNVNINLLLELEREKIAAELKMYSYGTPPKREYVNQLEVCVGRWVREKMGFLCYFWQV